MNALQVFVNTAGLHDSKFSAPHAIIINDLVTSKIGKTDLSTGKSPKTG
jgi:hypothetical protein